MLGAEIARLRSLEGIKWKRDPDDIIPAWVADMDFESPPEVKAAMQTVIDRGDFGYNLAARDQLLTTWGDWQHEHFGWRPPVDECKVFTATLNTLSMTLEMMTEPGDGVVLFTPIYHPFRAITEDSGRRIVDVPLDGPDWRLDPERFESIIDDDTKIVLFCNPHNPLGRVFDHDELAGFVDVCLRNDLLVIADEIWCDLTHEPKHLPLVHHFPAVAERCVTLGSASKSFSLAGLRTSVAHLGDPRVRAAFDALPGHYVGAPSTLGAEATQAAWTQCGPWLEQVKQQLTANRDHLLARIASDLPGVTMHAPEATYLAWMDFAGTSIAADPAEDIFERGRVSLHAGSKFSPAWASHVRLNFATSPAILDEIVDRIASTL